MVQAYRLATPLPCRRPDGWALARLSKSEAHYCVPMSAHIPRSQGRARLLSWRLLDGYLSVIDHDEECHDADRFDRLLRASEESSPRRAIGPEDKTFENHSQTTAETFRFKLMSHCSTFCTCRFSLSRPRLEIPHNGLPYPEAYPA